MNFRTRLKLIFKEWQRGHLDFNVLRYTLNNLGLECPTIVELNSVLRQPNAYAKGRHFIRIGKAAKKAGKLVFLKDIADYAQMGADLRKVPFYRPQNEIFGHVFQRLTTRAEINLTPVAGITFTYATGKTAEEEKIRRLRQKVDSDAETHERALSYQV